MILRLKTPSSRNQQLTCGRDWRHRRSGFVRVLIVTQITSGLAQSNMFWRTKTTAAFIHDKNTATNKRVDRSSHLHKKLEMKHNVEVRGHGHARHARAPAHRPRLRTSFFFFFWKCALWPTSSVVLRSLNYRGPRSSSRPKGSTPGQR